MTISDYSPEEPGELFFRLNQPTNLTSAEQRNAYFGEARQQVKDISNYMVELGFSRENLGFSNSRMAYDDVVAKFLIALEIGSLQKKVTAGAVTARYREQTGFGEELVSESKRCLSILHKALAEGSFPGKLNKATVYSWLVFIYVSTRSYGDETFVVEFFSYFESLRSNVASGFIELPAWVSPEFVEKMFEVYQDRASSRVADTSSVILRDIIIWMVWLFGGRNLERRTLSCNLSTD